MTGRGFDFYPAEQPAQRAARTGPYGLQKAEQVLRLFLFMAYAYVIMAGLSPVTGQVATANGALAAVFWRRCRTGL